MVDVFGVGFDFGEVERVELANEGAAVEGVDVKAEELLTEEGELGLDGIDAQGHVVVGVEPEGIDDLLDAGVDGDDARAATEHEGGGLLDDGVREGVGAIGEKRFAEKRLAVELVAVGVGGGGTDEGGAAPAAVFSAWSGTQTTG